MLRHTTLCAFVVFIMVMGAAYAQGRRSDTCGDHWGSNAWGLCNAYCEAKDCDSPENYGSPSCTQIYENFMEVASEGEEMPCEITPAASPQYTGGCPCNFNVQSWTTLSQILPTNLPMCGEAPCFMCQVSLIAGPTTTFLSVLVNLLDGSSTPEEKLLFFTTAPSSGEGTCFSSSSFTSEVPIPIEGGPLTFDQYSACVSDIGDLKDAYASMCNQGP